MNRVITAFLVCLLTIVCAGFVQSQTQPQVPPPGKRILLLHAYGDGVPVYQKTTPAFLAVMQAAGVSFNDLFFEYLDLQRNKGAEHRRNLATLFRHKYADKKIDLIITVHELALNFILHEGKDLFPGIPAVSYFTPDEVQISDTSRRFLVMPMCLDNRGTLDMALTLFPKTRLVVYIADLSKSGQKLENEAKKAFAPWQDKLKFEYTSNLTVEEMLQRVASLPPGTIVIYNNAWTDKTGRTFIGRDVGDKVIKAANVAVFSLYDTLIGRGIVGGSLLSFEAEAKRAGKFALDILNGKLVLTEPVTTIAAPGTPMLDWRELVRWEVSEDRVPKRSLIVNRSQSFWQLYKQYIIAVAVFILGLLILVFVLLLQIHRRKETEKTLNEYVGQLDGMVKVRTSELTRANEQLLNEITERKQAEEALSNSERKYRNIFENATEGIFQSTPEGRYITVNPAFARIGGYSSPDEMIEAVTDIQKKMYVHQEDRARLLELLNKQDIINNFEAEIRRRDNAIIWISMDVKAIRDQCGKIILLEGTIEDITERKRAEEKIRASLLEKETMLREIHHRVKNNLQVISSLLGLQSGYVQDEQSRKIFQESMGRVSTMAKIHTMLYQSADMSRVDFGGFIRDLASRLQQSSGTAGSPVGVNVNVSDVSLTIETSIPCGLILNELVSNSLKHAFPEGRGGEVNISMTKVEDRFVLAVQDNGIGFPAAVDFQNTKSLGLELVNLLVGQINGSIELHVEGGTTFTITFPAVSKRG